MEFRATPRETETKPTINAAKKCQHTYIPKVLGKGFLISKCISFTDKKNSKPSTITTEVKKII
jgi:hypothetical protein